MPTKRRSTRKPTPPTHPTKAVDRVVGSKKPVNPSLNLILKRLDKIDQRLETFEQNTAAEFRTVRGEMAQGLEAVRGEMTQGFDSLRQEFKTELQHVSDNAYEHYLRIENERRADLAEFRENQRKLLTGMDSRMKEHEQIRNDHLIIDAEHQDLKKNVETLKKRDMEKAAAIAKIEKDLDKLKAA
ncbi:MAG: hypothetical protein ALAOOOJD_04074 [bacterium]|nr:hypothetical protein [bacterium]